MVVRSDDGELPHQLLLRAAFSSRLNGQRLTKRERCAALKEAAEYYTPAAFAVEVARAIRAHNGQ